MMALLVEVVVSVDGGTFIIVKAVVVTVVGRGGVGDGGGLKSVECGYW